MGRTILAAGAQQADPARQAGAAAPTAAPGGLVLAAAGTTHAAAAGAAGAGAAATAETLTGAGGSGRTGELGLAVSDASLPCTESMTVCQEHSGGHAC